MSMCETDGQAVTAGCHVEAGYVIMSKIYPWCGWQGNAVVNTAASQSEGLLLFLFTTHLCEVLFYLYIPQPQLRAVIRTTGYQIGVIWAPRQVGNTVSMALQSLRQFQLLGFLSNQHTQLVSTSYFSSHVQTHVSLKEITDYRINMPHNDCGVFGTSCQFCAIVRKLAEPDFVAVFSEYLLSVAWELFPTDEEQTHTRQTR